MIATLDDGSRVPVCDCCGRLIAYKNDRLVRLFASIWCGNCVSDWFRRGDK